MKGCTRKDTVNKALLAKENCQIYIIIYFIFQDILSQISNFRYMFLYKNNKKT